MEVFVYGTLTDPDRAASVLDSFAYRGPATLDGLHRVDGEYPTMAPGGSVDGRILATGEVAALDRYEGVERGLYVRVSVPVAGGEGGVDGESGCGATVETYVGDPDRLDAPAEWPGEGSFAERVVRYVETGDVTASHPEGGTFGEFDGYEGTVDTDVATDHDDWSVE